MSGKVLVLEEVDLTVEGPTQVGEVSFIVIWVILVFFGVISDRRTKKDIVEINNGYKYHWTIKPSDL